MSGSIGKPAGTVAVIPARGGSKSIPRKNIVPCHGKPLIAWTIEVALQVPEIDRVVVSTDSEEIAEVARRHGAEISYRPAALATDHALVLDALRDLLTRLANEEFRPRVLVLLQPTSPLRIAQDIRDCLERLKDDELDSVATFKEAALNPARAWRIRDGRPEIFLAGANPWLPRQLLPEAHELNGAVYAFRADRLQPEHGSVLFGRAAAVLMPQDRSVDVDYPVELMLAELLLARRGAG